MNREYYDNNTLPNAILVSSEVYWLAHGVAGAHYGLPSTNSARILLIAVQYPMTVLRSC